MTAPYDYYALAHPDEGVGAGFRYRNVATVSARTLGYDEPPNETMLYDQPAHDRAKARVTGPFTVEAVPAPTVKPLDDIEESEALPADTSVARTGPTVRQGDWRDELLKTGIRGKAGQRISFTRLEPLPGTRWLHAAGETRPDDAGADVREPATARDSSPLVVSFGQDHAPLEQRQVARAIEEAQSLVPKPKIIVFAAFQFDPEAAKDIDETHWPGVALLKAQMNADLLTDDLKKKRASNESFWLIGQPDVEIVRIAEEKDKETFRISVRGFDYYNTKTGNVESGGADRNRPGGCWTRTMTGAACFRVRCSFPWPASRTGGRSSHTISRPRSTRAGSKPTAAPCLCRSRPANTDARQSRLWMTVASRV